MSAPPPLLAASAAPRWRRLAHPVLWLALGATALCLLIGASAWWVSVSSMAAQRALSLAALNQAADTYETQLLRSLHELDQTLRLIGLIGRSKGPAQTLEVLRQERLLPPEQLFQAEIVARAPPRGDTRLLLGNGLVIDLLGAQGVDRRLRLLREIPGLAGAHAQLTFAAEYIVAGFDAQRLGSQGRLSLQDDQGLTIASAGGAAPPEPPTQGAKRLVAQRPIFGHPLVVVVEQSEEEQLAAMRKQGRSHALLAAVVSLLVGAFALVLALMYRRLERERKAHAREMQALAYDDALTGLANRRRLIHQLEHELLVAARHGRSLAVMFIDLDGFKAINDRLGHEAGDQLLQEVARRIEASIRAGDLAARLGGDEFVVVLTHTSQVADIEAAAQRLIQDVAQPITLGAERAQVTTSAGIAVYPSAGDTADALMRSADAAMYQAKQAGKNRYSLAGPEVGLSA